MIETHEIPDGLLLSVEPFGDKDQSCQIIAEVKWSKSKGRVVRFSTRIVRHMMPLSDMTILMNAMRRLVDEVNERTKDQKKAVKRVKR
jgi:hypothetical protein